MSFNDDEPIVAIQDVSGEKAEHFIAELIKATVISKSEAPLEETKFKVMLELMGVGSGNHRSGVDLVTVLDVSGSMQGEKLARLKTAMQFVIKKLSPIDRLSVVTFARDSCRLCPLRQINENSQAEIENLVNALVTNDGTNITAGLQTGLKVLNDRSLTNGRVAGIMLLSDGQQNTEDDAAQVQLGNVPIYTFGFGADHDPRVLKAIADNSPGGTFSDVQDIDNLSIAISQCFAGLLTVVVQDLTLSVTQDESTIEKVSSGNYPQTRDDAAGSVAISFGDLYDQELRKVIVDLSLPAVPSQASANVLDVDYTYRIGGKLFTANPLCVTVTRTGTSMELESDGVITEENRLRTAEIIEESRVLADNNKLDNAQEKLVDALNLVENVVDESNNPLLDALKDEVQQLLRLMKSQEIYEKQGRPFALSSETSHDRQRFAARGDVEEIRLFATPRMDAYLEQARSFDEDPSKAPPSVDDDVEQEPVVDPHAPISGA
ncbi:von Willebrand factor, type A [Trema orientale]|uniref:von Willebrand factor, type A n=1 Tax=Trema orientale TaxID=63057 RepID=A0A2P5DD85_TREOI|nr:von Willebrand factor, type A [Trema orientale]